MQFDEVAVFKSNKQGGCILEAKGSRRLRVLGSSIPCAGVRGVPVEFSTLSFVEHGEALVVLTVLGEGRGEYAFSVHIRWEKEQQPVADTKNRFVPLPGRLLQVTTATPELDSSLREREYPRMEVTLQNGVIAVNKDYRRSSLDYRPRDPEDNFLHVPDGDLLCRYLIGKADLSEITEYADGWVVEAQARIALVTAKRETSLAKHELDRANERHAAQIEKLRGDLCVHCKRHLPKPAAAKASN